MPPTIPTSFVPRQTLPGGPSRPTRFNMSGLFFTFALFVLGLALVSAAGVFAYEKYLSAQTVSKAGELATAEKGVSQSTVQEFVDLQNRLLSAKGLLDSHVTLSSFFKLLEAMTLQRVQYTSLKLAVGTDHTASLDAVGVAASFNALAAESKAFSANPEVARAVFSNFITQKDGGVTFTLGASIKPSTVENFSPAAGPTTAAPVASTTVLAPSFAQPAATTTTTKMPAPPTPPAPTPAPAL